MTGVLVIDAIETSGAIGSISPDVGSGYTQQLSASSGQWESEGDRFRHSTNVTTANPPVKALFTVDDTPAANSECYLTFRLDTGSPGTDDPLFAIARWTDNDNFYGIGGYPSTSNGLVIFKNVSGTVTSLATATGSGNSLVSGVNRGYTVHVSDSVKELIEQTTQLISSTDNAHTSGKYGFAEGDWVDSANDISSSWLIENFLLIEKDSNVKLLDRFRDTSTTTLASHTPDHIGTAWTKQTGSGSDAMQTLNSSLVDALEGSTGTLNASTTYTVTPAPSQADYDIYVPWGSHSGGIGEDEPFWILGRWADSSNYYNGGIYPGTGGDMVLCKTVSGTVTSLASNTSITMPTDGGVQILSITDATKLLRWSYQGTDTDVSSSDNALTSSGSWGVGTGNIGTSASDDINADSEWWAFIAIETGSSGHTGTATPTLDAFTVDAVGVMHPEATGTLNLQALTVDAVGEIPAEATATPNLETMSVAAVGEMLAEGAATPTLQTMAVDAVGEMQLEATGAPTLEELVVTAVGEQPHEGVGVPIIQDVTVVSTGVQKFLGTGSPILQTLSIDSTGVLVPSGISSPLIEELIITAVSESPHIGTGNIVLQNLIVIASGTSSDIPAAAAEGARLLVRPGRMMHP